MPDAQTVPVPAFPSPSSSMSHTIVLIQPDAPASRTYSDYDTVTEAMEGEFLLCASPC